METEKRDINIGERIRNFRKQKGLSQHQVAEALAVSTSVISNLENNKSMVGVYTLLQILEVLDIGVEELLPPGVRPSPADLRDPAGALERLEDPWRRRFRLLPYRSVGVDRGLLLAVRVDQVQVGEEARGPMLAALSPTPVSDGGGYRALLGAD